MILYQNNMLHIDFKVFYYLQYCTFFQKTINLISSVSTLLTWILPLVKWKILYILNVWQCHSWKYWRTSPFRISCSRIWRPNWSGRRPACRSRRSESPCHTGSVSCPGRRLLDPPSHAPPSASSPQKGNDWLASPRVKSSRKKKNYIM